MIYILPAGIGCDMIKEIQSVNKIETILTTKDEVKWYKKETITLNKIFDPRKLTDDEQKMFTMGRPADNAGMLVNIASWKQNKNSNGGN